MMSPRRVFLLMMPVLVSAGSVTSAGGRIPLEPGRIVGGQPVGLISVDSDVYARK